jgi:hypothetical protein
MASAAARRGPCLATRRARRQQSSLEAFSSQAERLGALRCLGNVAVTKGGLRPAPYLRAFASLHLSPDVRRDEEVGMMIDAARGKLARVGPCASSLRCVTTSLAPVTASVFEIVNPHPNACRRPAMRRGSVINGGLRFAVTAASGGVAQGMGTGRGTGERLFVVICGGAPTNWAPKAGGSYGARLPPVRRAAAAGPKP